MDQQRSYPNVATATLAGGCFWCLEAVFDELDGVAEVESGYAGGRGRQPHLQASLRRARPATPRWCRSPSTQA